MRRFALMMLATMILLIPQLVQAWEWEVDETILNPTGFPLQNTDIAVWAIYDPSPHDALSWVALEADGGLLRLIPQWDGSGSIVGWTEDRAFFDTVTAPESAYQIFVGEWNPSHFGQQLMFVNANGTIAIWYNNGTVESPEWQTSVNTISPVFNLVPPYGIATGNLDGDDILDLVFLHEGQVSHAEWDAEAEGWVTQTSGISMEMPDNMMGIRTADLDGDGDMDFILTENHQNVFLSYQVYLTEYSETVREIDYLSTLPYWHGAPIPADLDGDGSLELAYADGYARAVIDSVSQWQDPVTFVGGPFDTMNRAEDGTIRYIQRPAWYQATGYHWTLRSGEIGSGGYQLTGWDGGILNNNYGTGGTVPRTGSIFDDMNGDGVTDLLVITNPGEMTAFRNDGTDEVPVYVADETLFPLDLFNTPWNIQGHDLDGNGYVDYMFYREGRWLIYMGGAEEDGSRYWDRNDELASTIIQLGEGIRIFGDVDGDGDADVIFTSGSHSQLFLNEERSGERIFDQEPGALPEDVGFYDGTYCFDFDGDGTEDIAQGRKVYLSRLNGDAAENDPLPYRIQLAIAPNPFNSMTRVTLALPEREEVRAGLYNMLGQQVATLNQGVLQPGIHHIAIDGSGYASGVYLLQLEAFGQVHQRRLVLVK